MIIGISGKIGSGKDTIGQIIQYLASKETASFEAWQQAQKKWKGEYTNSLYQGGWQIKKVADKLKDIVCLLLGCTREQLEDEEFKNKELGEEWWYYKFYQGVNDSPMQPYLVPYIGNENSKDKHRFKHPIIKLTPRKIMQLLGTEGMRNVIHPNVHVNALFADYKGGKSKELASELQQNWLVTDVRFKNEVEAIKQRNGILIKTERLVGKRVYVIENEQPFNNWYGIVDYKYNYDNYGVIPEDNILTDEAVLVPKNQITLQDEHESETALDNYQDWDYIIDNNGSLDKLVDLVKEILIKEKLI